MGIMLVEKGGRTCPVIICDVCGQEIDDAKKGCYLWDRTPIDGKQWPPTFAHQGQCFVAAMRRIEQAGGMVCDVPLKWFAVYLLANLGVDPRKKLPEEWIEMAAMF